MITTNSRLHLGATSHYQLNQSIRSMHPVVLVLCCLGKICLLQDIRTTISSLSHRRIEPFLFFLDLNLWNACPAHLSLV